MAYSSPPAAVLFDMDGTLVDSEPYWMGTEIEIMAAQGIEWTIEDGMKLVGNTLKSSAALMQSKGLSGSVEEIADSLCQGYVAKMRKQVPWRPGVRRLLDELKAAGIARAMVTGTFRYVLDPVLDALPGGMFDAVLSGDEVHVGKPDPESYLLAAQRLGVPIERCVAIEDSVTGVQAAYASGAPTLAVPIIVPIAPRPGLSRADSLEKIDLAVLTRIVNGEAVTIGGELGTREESFAKALGWA